MQAKGMPEVREISTRNCGKVTVSDLTLEGWELLRSKLAAVVESGIVQEFLTLLPALQRALGSIGSDSGMAELAAAAELAKANLQSMLSKATKGLASGVDLAVLQHCLTTQPGTDLNKLSAKEFQELRAKALEVNDLAALLESEKNFWAGLLGTLLPRAQAGSATSSPSAASTG